MSQFDFESSPEGDWDDRGELAWNEFHWQHYLKRTDKDIDRFLSAYEKLKNSPDRLDDVAHELGWDHEEWAATEPGIDDGVGYGFETQDRFRDENTPDAEHERDELDPYTLHRHPVFIVTAGLYHYLRRNWELAMAQQIDAFSPTLVWRYAESLRQGEFNAILAIQALDMGDYALTVCHLKSALSSVNQSMSILQQLAGLGQNHFESLYNGSRIRLFDLREVWLRIMRDCRDEVQRRSREGE